ncbi:MAG: hypothetical protein JO171_17725 [Paludibacterium sp.]|uniref:hypothetical protein n=1 Tax=Paludibacterium sp. TaxID=1917523 RepID=UPI0025F4A88E|nr:hypothetical protein [Paludibacterium sp.]MBV8048993.1 hypothetical protein [Paludibacterium sp.]MBV8647490.1 hypothetical protein [Paludibacterium sp.]
MMNLADLTVVRMAGIEAVEALEMWGRWQRQGVSRGRAQGIEGRFRSQRCELCYEAEEPCSACRVSGASATPLDERLVLAVEAAMTYGAMKVSLGGGRQRITDGCNAREQALLLAHYRGFRGQDGRYHDSHPRVICRQLGLPFQDYDAQVARATLSVWNRAKRRISTKMS